MAHPGKVLAGLAAAGAAAGLVCYLKSNTTSAARRRAVRHAALKAHDIVNDMADAVTRAL